ncbi:MAG: multicopper oxidase domain-containing protein, partial [Alphaproteobacteria bacterium]|nr:multicopper oxidase domain-containing protein [Alphaproteobacteria bacterium]
MITRRQFQIGGLALAGLAFANGRAANAAAPPVVLRPRPAEARLLEAPEPLTRIWGYDGRVPGPLLAVEQGGRLELDLINALPQPTTVHWHGIRIDNAMDGVANLTQPPIAADDRFRYGFT